MNKKIILVLLLVVCCWPGAFAQQVAVKTNALYWAAATPNIGAEIAVSKHSTLNVTMNWNPWTRRGDNKFKHFYVRPEYRYWVTEKFTRLFFSAHLIGGQCEIGGFRIPIIGNKVGTNLPNRYYHGTYFGAGLGIGYQFYISPHWNLELSAGAGLIHLDYYSTPIDGSAKSPRTTTKRILPVPTELGITFVYLFNSKK